MPCYHLEGGVGRVGIKVGEVVAVPELANLLIRIGLGNMLSLFFSIGFFPEPA